MGSVGSLYAAETGGVVAYGGFRGTTFTTKRMILTLPTGVGEVNSLVLGPDGRMRVGVSAPCDHCIPTLADSAAVLSFNPDGTDLQVEASGIRAPVELAYCRRTSDLFVTMNQRDDLGDQTPGDWLAVVQTGQSWGFPDCYGQGGSVCSGVPTPVATLDKHAAVSDVAIVTGQLGATVGTSAIVAEWATGSVLRVALTKTGSTYSGTVAPFLTGIQKPVAVLAGTGRSPVHRRLADGHDLPDCRERLETARTERDPKTARRRRQRASDAARTAPPGVASAARHRPHPPYPVSRPRESRAASGSSIPRP